jgi:hypothetical protein
VGGSCDRVAGDVPLLRQYRPPARRARPGPEPGFTILDRSDAEDVVNLLRSRAGLDLQDRRFPRKNAIPRILSMAGESRMTVPDMIAVDGWRT